MAKAAAGKKFFSVQLPTVSPVLALISDRLFPPLVLAQRPRFSALVLPSLGMARLDGVCLGGMVLGILIELCMLELPRGHFCDASR